MKAILLAGGVGSRISDSINKLPKSLLEVNNVPLIVNAVKLLQKNHIEVIVVTGFKHKLVEKALEDYNVKIYYNPFFSATNSIGSLWFARDEFNITKEMIIANADLYYNQDLLNVIFNSEKKNFMLKDKKSVETGDYFFRTNKDGTIAAYGKDLLLSERDSEYVGIACLKDEWVSKFRDRMCNMIENGEYNLWWENVLYSFASSEKIHTEDVGDVFWSEVDKIEDYNRILRYIKENNK